MEKWAEVRVLFHREGLSQRAIARRLGISRDTVKNAVEAREPSKCERPPVATSFDPFRARVWALLVDYPGMPASVLSQRVGWISGESTLRRHVAGLREQLAPVDPADRLEYVAGDQCQCDLWFPPVKIPLGNGLLGTGLV